MLHRPVSSVIDQQTLITASVDTTVTQAAQSMRERNVGALLVMNGTRLVGIFTERDALFRVLAVARDPQTTRVGDVMTRDPQTIHPDKPFAHALHMMYEGGFRHVPVVSDDKVLGMGSSRDGMRVELQDFESELVRREHIVEILG